MSTIEGRFLSEESTLNLSYQMKDDTHILSIHSFGLCCLKMIIVTSLYICYISKRELRQLTFPFIKIMFKFPIREIIFTKFLSEKYIIMIISFTNSVFSNHKHLIDDICCHYFILFILHYSKFQSN